MYYISSSLPKQADVVFRDIMFADEHFVSAVNGKYGGLIPRSNPNQGAINAARRRLGIEVADKVKIDPIETGDVIIVVSISGPRPRMGSRKVYSDEQLERLKISFRAYLAYVLK